MTPAETPTRRRCKLCPSPHYAQGLCNKHYQRRRDGRPINPPPASTRRLPKLVHV